MGENTKISWTDNSLNLWWGCQEVATGCDNCYAKVMARRLSQHNIWGHHAPRMEIKSWEKNLFRWQRTAEEVNDRRNVFVGSMMDIFERDRPLINRQGERVEGVTTDSLRARFFRYLEQDALPNLIFQLLTKRPQNIEKMLPFNELPHNVMIGTSISTSQDIETHLFPLLASSFVGKRFVSIEPLVGPIHLSEDVLKQLDWVIIGGESGSNARPMHPYWPHDLIIECERAGVPVFFKQWGEWREAFPSDSSKNMISINFDGEIDSATMEGGLNAWIPMKRVGRDVAGSEIHGKHYHQYPMFDAWG